MRNVFKYSYKGNNLYGQGLDEAHVRSCIETRKGLPQGTLRKPSFIKSSDMKKISNDPDWDALLLKLSLPESHKSKTLKEIYNKCSLKSNVITIIICDELNIEKSLYNSLDKDTVTLGDLSKYTNNKLLVRISKHIKKPVTKEVFDGVSYKYTTRNTLISIQSRPKLIRKEIDRLFKRDYTLLTDRDFESEITMLESSLYRALSALKNPKNRNNEKLISIKNNAPNEIKDLKEAKKKYENIIHNTGYYVHDNNNEYEYKNYIELNEAFDNYYEKLRLRITRNYMDNIVMKGDSLTLLELLDSYELIKRANNENYSTTEEVRNKLGIVKNPNYPIIKS